LVRPIAEDLAHGVDAVSLAILGEPALEVMSAVSQCGQFAAWWGDDFELIPSQASQH
jgi:hypothetical protein